jgi:hypothetical protein
MACRRRPGLVQPPAEATIMDLSASLDGNRVFDAYVSAIKQTFGSEPWEDIERFAERVWLECRFDGDPEWTGIRERIQAQWPMARSVPSIRGGRQSVPTRDPVVEAGLAGAGEQ